MNQSHDRAALQAARRIVIKIGSRILVQASGRPETQRVRALIRDIAALKHEGREVVVVTSGAIGTGMDALGIRRRPTRLPDLQMTAAIGQSRLMTLYDRMFTAERCLIGQVLLTHNDLKHRVSHLNARNTMLTMLQRGVIPIVNENDVVAMEEIKFGDNDLLAALVVHLLNADLLILLTTTDGLRKTDAGGRAHRVSAVQAITQDVLELASGKESPLSTGGMFSKLESAGAATKAGATVVIADGRKAGILQQILAGEDTGTLIPPTARNPQDTLNARERWIAFFHKPKGVLLIDDGARRALEQNGKSLLPIGIKHIEGDFEAGDAVEVKTLDQGLIARGLVAYSSRDIRLIRGHRTDDIARILGTDGFDEVIHRDNMVLMKKHSDRGLEAAPAFQGNGRHS
ncbi:MAG: glutamate 5-kinase [Verrucomicrobia bacterium]|nr:glutamate 5-kinase [Verrucomicrobiota bacterium]MBU4290496.1 glutamate 5-kinase [Verrucomicrobiota bacterium]MBU4497477.1 glutamate 5-kinase [Verrucomicrobiota bacterium]